LVENLQVTGAIRHDVLSACQSDEQAAARGLGRAAARRNAPKLPRVRVGPSARRGKMGARM